MYTSSLNACERYIIFSTFYGETDNVRFVTRHKRGRFATENVVPSNLEDTGKIELKRKLYVLQ